ncbi:hypothetical protein BJ170DRAFT_714660 [Xylariales sp. AK1849]|nr:hypothetical protein BJ170DRAFT_714660 [Xylariales sp. AK1849]
MPLKLCTLIDAAQALPGSSAPHRETTRDLKTGSSGMLLDRFGESDLDDFHEWVGKMIEEGHLYHPNVTGDGMMFARSDSWYVKLKNVGCNTVTGNRDLVDKTQTHFCSFVKQAEQLAAMEMETDVTNVLCNTHSFCKLGVRFVFDTFNIFKEVDDVTKLCNEMYDELNKACPDGGVADAEVGKNNGARGESYAGQLESSFNLDDNSSCQESATHECFDGSVPA